jgi:hypothetical protein
MASPVSIGDAILLAKIAFNIGKAFTSGAKSAPNEFLEIQSLLTSISESLAIIHSVATGRLAGVEPGPSHDGKPPAEPFGEATSVAKLNLALENTRRVLMTAN